jgi:hypothetical protein
MEKKVILFPELGSKGRLGNQLFQLASMLALSFETNSKIKLPSNLYSRIMHGQKCLLEHFKHNLVLMNSEEEYIYNSQEHVSLVFPQENDKWDRENFLNIEFDKIHLHNWPESELYFKKYKDKIKERLSLVDTIQEIGDSYINTIKKANQIPIEVVGIHIRRGDVIPDINELQWNHIIVSIKKTINIYFNDKKYKFLFFTGGSHTNDNSDDVKWIKNNFNDLNYSVCESNNILSDLASMIACDHMILTSRSTIGWWGAYLNKKDTKRIYVPKYTFPPIPVNASIFWAEEFIQIEMYNLLTDKNNK